MILVADLVLAAESSKFTLAYTRAGLVPDGSSTYFLPRLVGLRRARELILTNRVLDAREALEWQLVNRVVPDDVLHEEAESLALKLAEGPLQAHGKVKQLLAETFSNQLETQMEEESQALSESISGTEAQEGIQAFMEKRTPVF